MNILACLIGMKHYVVEGYTILNYLNLKPIRRISYNTMPVFSSFTASDLIYKMNMTYPITHNNDDSSTYLSRLMVGTCHSPIRMHFSTYVRSAVRLEGEG